MHEAVSRSAQVRVRVGVRVRVRVSNPSPNTNPDPNPDPNPSPNPQSGAFSLTIGGDHSIAAASIAAVQAAYPTLGVIWVDAHADANTPDTSPSMHYHGMPAAHLMGWFRRRPPGFDWFPERTVLPGARPTLPAESRRTLPSP